MMEVQRVLLLFVLAFILLLIYQRWVEYQHAHTTPAAPPTVSSPPGAAPSTGNIPETPSVDIPAAPEAQAPHGEAAAPEKPADLVVVETDLLRAEIDTLGGGIKKLSLIDYPVSVDKPDVPFELLKQEGGDIFITQSGLIGKGSEFPNHRTHYRASRKAYRLNPGDQEVTVPLEWQASDGTRYTKKLIFKRNSYTIRVEFEIDNRSSSDWTGFLYAQFLRSHVVQKRGFFLGMTRPTYLGGAIYTPDDKFEKIKFSKMVDEDLDRQVASGWVAMLQHYFVGAWFPREGEPFKFYTRVIDEADGPRYNIGYNTLHPTVVAAGSTGSIGVDLYAGPTEQERLKAQAEGFELTVDYGWLTPLSVPIFWLLDKIHSVVNNWGWSIILLTCLIKLAFFPLSATSYKSMAKMKKLQPRLQTLKERFGSDKAKLNQAMMEIYKKEKVNPLGGCLPIVVQIPVFIALYWVLLESVELRQAPFGLWIKDLSIRDPYFVLPILMGTTMLAQQLLNPSPVDPMQKRIMMAMPIVFTFLFLYFPAGLVLYWLVNNILSITQQWYVNKVVIGQT